MKREAHTDHTPKDPRYTKETPLKLDTSNLELGEAALAAASIKLAYTPSPKDVRPRVLIDEQGDLLAPALIDGQWPFSKKVLGKYSQEDWTNQLCAAAEDRVNRYMELIGGPEAIDFLTIRQELIDLFSRKVGLDQKLVIRAFNRYIQKNRDRIDALDDGGEGETTSQGSPGEAPEDAAGGGSTT